MNRRVHIVLSNAGGELARVEVRQSVANGLVELTQLSANAANRDLVDLLNNLQPGDVIRVEEVA